MDVPVGSAAYRLGKKQAEIKVYSITEGVELNRQLIPEDFVIMKASCPSFFVVCTAAPRSQLFIFNSRSTLMIKSGLSIEGVCFLDVSEECMSFAVLTLKGHLHVYRVKNLGDALFKSASLIDACEREWTTPGLAEVLRQKSGNQLATVKYMKLMNDGSVLVFLSGDHGVLEYDPRVRVWRQTMVPGCQATILYYQLKQGPSSNSQVNP
jgi:hypothetical protein